ncbi:unnamed protein product [Parajaminaea phylloscopi]
MAPKRKRVPEAQDNNSDADYVNGSGDDDDDDDHGDGSNEVQSDGAASVTTKKQKTMVKTESQKRNQRAEGAAGKTRQDQGAATKTCPISDEDSVDGNPSSSSEEKKPKKEEKKKRASSTPKSFTKEEDEILYAWGKELVLPCAKDVAKLLPGRTIPAVKYRIELLFFRH